MSEYDIGHVRLGLSATAPVVASQTIVSVYPFPAEFHIIYYNVFTEKSAD
jgi:hypothetical protein